MLLLLLRRLLLGLWCGREDCERGRALLRRLELSYSSTWLLLYVALRLLLLLLLKTWLKLERRLLLRLLLLSELLRLLKSV